MGVLGTLGKWIWNGAKSVAGSFGFDTSGYENDEGQNFQAKQAQMSRDWQERMLQKQFDYQTDMWNKSNRYNSPSAQMQRYREAGLNPYMMMSGGGNAGVATSHNSPSGMSAPSVSGAIANPHSTPAGQFINNIANAKAQTANARLANADASLKEVQAQTYARELMARIVYDEQRGKNVGIKNQYEGSILDATYKSIRSETGLRDAQASLTRAQEYAQSITNKYIGDETKQRIALMASQMDLVDEQTGLVNVQASHELEKKIKTTLEAEGVKNANYVAKESADAIIAKAKYEAYAKYSSPSEALSRVGQHLDNAWKDAKSRIGKWF